MSFDPSMCEGYEALPGVEARRDQCDEEFQEILAQIATWEKIRDIAEKKAANSTGFDQSEARSEARQAQEAVDSLRKKQAEKVGECKEIQRELDSLQAVLEACKKRWQAEWAPVQSIAERLDELHLVSIAFVPRSVHLSRGPNSGLDTPGRR